MKTYTIETDLRKPLCFLSDDKGNAVPVFNHSVKDMKLTTLRKTKYNIAKLNLGDKYHAL